MHRYDELEKLYYKKKYKKIFFIIFVFFIIVILFLFICKHHHKSNKKIIFHPEKIEINKPLKVQNKINKTKKIKSKKLKSKKNVNLKSVQEITFILPDINKTKEKTIINQSSKIKKHTSIKSNIKEVNNTKRIERNFNNIHIVETSIKNVNILITKYNQNPNYDLAIMISKFFFNENELKKAQMWALKANGMNPEKVDSWIIFANILIKEKKINKAREILKTYLNSYGQNDIIEKKLRSMNE